MLFTQQLIFTLTTPMWRHGGKILVLKTEVLWVKIFSETIIVSCTYMVIVSCIYTVVLLVESWTSRRGSWSHTCIGTSTQVFIYIREAVVGPPIVSLWALAVIPILPQTQIIAIIYFPLGAPIFLDPCSHFIPPNQD